MATFNRHYGTNQCNHTLQRNSRTINTMASNLMESKQCSGRSWDCPMCAMKIYPPRMGEIRQPVSLVGTCSHDICMSCIIATACPVQLKKAIDKGKSVEVHCPIVFGEKGDGCGGKFLIDGQQWEVSEGRLRMVWWKID